MGPVCMSLQKFSMKPVRFWTHLVSPLVFSVGNLLIDASLVPAPALLPAMQNRLYLVDHLR